MNSKSQVEEQFQRLAADRNLQINGSNNGQQYNPQQYNPQLYNPQHNQMQQYDDSMEYEAAHPSIIKEFEELDDLRKKLYKEKFPLDYIKIMRTIEKQRSRGNNYDQGPHSQGHGSQGQHNQGSQQLPIYANQQMPMPQEQTHKHIQQEAPIQKQGPLQDITLDFRNNLVDINHKNEYTILTKLDKVNYLEIKSCIINTTYNILNEPYIYIVINNINGDYNPQYNIFGKLILVNNISGNMYYVPDNCIKIFDNPEKLYKLTFSFLNFEFKPIKINNIPISKISKKENCITIYTKCEHYLTINDKINIIKMVDDEIITEQLNILEIHNNLQIITTIPNNINLLIKNNNNTIIEKINIRASITLKVK